MPPVRPGGAAARNVAGTAPSAEALIQAARLRGNLGYVVVNTANGQVVEALRPATALPPASVIKAVTTLYALDALEPQQRFVTRLLATGPVQGGQLNGDLILLGGGDPTLGSDGVGALAQRLRDAGVRRVTGRFLVHGGSYPSIREIAAEQPVQAGYNPAVSGLNLNFNRVHFRWERSGSGYQVVMEAPDQRFRPGVSMARMQVVNRQAPVYTHELAGGSETWTVAQAALGGSGGRWLPVRQPELYAGDVFRAIANYYEISLPAPQLASGGSLRGTALAEHRSDPLREILRGMMRYSTNLTAEAVGLAASIARGGRPVSLAQSGQMMADWARARFGLEGPRFVDHSGLGDASRISAADMVRVLVAARHQGPLHGLMREFVMRDGQGNIQRNHPVEVAAKTGTLNFVSGLAGYARPRQGGAELAFAIFAADMDTRNGLRADQRDRPPGSRDWIGRARRLQQQLIERWGVLHA
ncbi:D-alanyl-D-alanine carboxypeptidase/D-alanyl-D-alanine-endopeptidase [Alkalilacustris brevis]|uniref:D-alanyl-D-alanine carboxypeptidase/D-alanyl-D-alanine endopeptidase n=1 Tax=Alkalilacustris brevis TaxID=2026338 RepID=UPI001EE49264|nr:D-alanyl-D-alanine carboxypeptidase/D-alanyl-D-alanine-endopeptidase [Alkalilacustris brevis]